MFEGANGRKALVLYKQGLFYMAQTICRQHPPRLKESGITPEADAESAVNIGA